MNDVHLTHLGPAECSIDLGDGSERGEYVNQDYILNSLCRPMRGISLMTSYYPLDDSFPQRAHDAFSDKEISFQWDYPYDDYETYKGGLIGLKELEPFNWMRDVRRHGQDVLLTITVDPHVGDDHIIAIAKDLSTFGRLLLRVNHEATGNWFSFNKRADYPEVASFFAHFCDIIHREAPNVKMIICLDGYKDLEEEKMLMEDCFLPAIKNADIFSCDTYLSLHWGWPYDIAEKGGTSFKRSPIDEIYAISKRSCNRYKFLAGEERPFVLSEFNADGDVTGPYEQAEMVEAFCSKLKEDKDNWLDAITMYQFRDRGRLGLEIEDPNNKDVGIPLPILDSFKKIIYEDKFYPKINDENENITLPITLRWGGSEDADGIGINVHFEQNPVFSELYFDENNIDANLMIEINKHWFYKAPGVKCVDLMPAFFKSPITDSCDMVIRIFAPPATGENDPSQGADWQTNYYYTLKSLPTIRIRTSAIM